MSGIITDTISVLIASITVPLLLRLLITFIIESVRIIAITVGQTIIRDYIEQHFRKKPRDRPDSGFTPIP